MYHGDKMMNSLLTVWFGCDFLAIHISTIFRKNSFDSISNVVYFNKIKQILKFFIKRTKKTNLLPYSPTIRINKIE